MATVKGPLLSMDASGQIAKTQVYGSWKGIAYSRRYVVPSNPKSTEQTLTRNTFKFLNALYQVSPSDFRGCEGSASYRSQPVPAEEQRAAAGRDKP